MKVEYMNYSIIKSIDIMFDHGEITKEESIKIDMLKDRASYRKSARKILKVTHQWSRIINLRKRVCMKAMKYKFKVYFDQIIGQVKNRIIKNLFQRREFVEGHSFVAYRNDCFLS